MLVIERNVLLGVELFSKTRHKKRNESNYSEILFKLYIGIDFVFRLSCELWIKIAVSRLDGRDV